MEDKKQQSGADIPEIFLAPYDPSANEEARYTEWSDAGYFNPDVCIEKGVTEPDAESFSIVLPPPNVTGTLHTGHASMLAIEDILVRFNRMRGKKTLWIPGTDSAALATQSKVEKELYKKEKKSRHDLGREEMLARIDDFVEESKKTIIGQVKRMGSSLDWSRYAYTMDDERNRAVTEAFVRMYNAGLIYRGNRIVNWDPKGQTTISDDEVVHEDRESTLYTFKYSKDFPITIATTRPETKVGDTAVAVHPDDERYKQYIGKTFEATFCDVPIKVTVIADEEVDPEFGTGALGVTPAHSKIDWDMAERHNIEDRPRVINEYAKMDVEGRLAGLKVNAAREAVVEWLREEGLLEHEEKVQQSVATAERTGAVIEPLPKLQWFIAVDKEFTIDHSEIPGVESGDTVTLKSLMRSAVEGGGIDIKPDRFNKIYYHWINNLRDWCISRQIWYGHRIPVWYHEPKCVPEEGKETELEKCEPIIVDAAGQDVEFDCPHCGAKYIQESDTLDTWFSSGLWTFSTLGWPEKTDDLATYHPTTVLETGYDILFFWVARMVLMSTFHLGQVPFKNVYLHGLVRDKHGRKMSKSLGNIIDPLDLIADYGADALRMALILGAAPGNDLNLDENKIKGYKHFANKVWNITRFVLTNRGDTTLETDVTYGETENAIVSQLREVEQEVTEHLERFELHLAAEKLYHYIWHELADKILEEAKPVLQGDDANAQAARAHALLTALNSSVRMLHPIMPHVTETIWQNLPDGIRGERMLMVTPWPSQE